MIETSGANVNIANSAVITTAAPYGKTGTWVIDPDGFTIAASGGDITGTTLGSELPLTMSLSHRYRAAATTERTTVISTSTMS